MLQHDVGEGDQHEDDSTVLLVEGRTYDREHSNYSKGATIMNIPVHEELAW